MRIAFLGLRAIGDCSGGVERHVEELAVRMVRMGHKVTVFCRTRYNIAQADSYQGISLANLPAIYSKHLEAISHTALAIPSVLFGFDIVHFHATGPSLLSWAPRLTGRKVVVTVHGLDYMRAKWGGFATIALKAGAWTAVNCPHRTIVVSKELERHYQEWYSKDTVHIPNGVSRPTTRPLDRLRKFELADKGYVLFLGRLVPEKGAHYLIEAFKGLDTGLKLVIAGDSSHSDDYLARLKADAAGDDRILFTGPLFGTEKDEAFSNARTFVLPSDLEGMPIVMLEAMSYGCPTLVSDIPECLEVFPGANVRTAGDIAATFKNGDSGSLRQNLAGLLGRTDLEEMGARAQSYVLERYDWDAIAKATLRVYEEATGSENA